ncbi:ABC transporter ATP-binding protein [Paenibacillus allorhizosphaerae]|uniref:Multidrug export ATP-binding/permease protein n=1 Tax=Paenibacillus allorhizosphaerae TaxID=2849866 RepID=A0ABN7TIK2_9BACL|nr:ABC transporter ATP-binding protein [Paenibacillus allorhizosphaerae]CAG7632555.1 Putative multidrug export ATP-binding/permease protein [Paenibacillus allorhizosphaerae]
MGIINKLHVRWKRYLEIGEVKKPLLLLLPYVARYWETYFWLFVLMFSGIGVTLFFTWFLQNMTDAAIGRNVSEVKTLLLYGVLFTVFSSVLSYFNTYLEAAAVVKVRTDLKNALFHHMMRLPAKYYGNQHSGEMVSRLTNDVNNIEGAIGSNMLSVVRLPLMAVGAFVYLFQINGALALLCVLLGPVAAVSGAVFGKLIRRNGRAVHDALGKLHSFLNDSFAGYAVIRSFTLEKQTYQQYESINGKLLGLEFKLARLRGWFQAGASSAGALSFFVCLGVGVHYVMNGSMSVGDLLAFVNLVQFLVYPLTGLAGMWGAFQRSVAALERVQEVFSEVPETRELPAYQPVSGVKGSIELKGIRFSYDGQTNALERFDLKIPAGKVVALVGPSGAGKSTLIHLLMGFYQPQEGEILFDGLPVSHMSRAQLRSCTAYVPQENYLFDGTVGDNIACGKTDSSEEQWVRAAKEANAHEFIVSLPSGYHTEIGERGVRLSGGQRQRIAIARAILKDAPVLLLDEATSALDSETEYQVQEALEKLMKDRTTIVVAHRLSTIHNADLIAVVDQGRVIEQGTHAELIGKNGLYARLYHIQYNQERSAASRLDQASVSLG